MPQYCAAFNFAFRRRNKGIKSHSDLLRISRRMFDKLKQIVVYLGYRITNMCPLRLACDLVSRLFSEWFVFLWRTAQYDMTGASRRYGTSCSYDFFSNRITKTGVFFSPLYPRNYSPFSRCQYAFHALAGEVVRLRFNRIQLDRTDERKYESLAVIFKLPAGGAYSAPRPLSWILGGLTSKRSGGKGEGPTSKRRGREMER